MYSTERQSRSRGNGDTNNAVIASTDMGTSYDNRVNTRINSSNVAARNIRSKFLGKQSVNKSLL